MKRGLRIILPALLSMSGLALAQDVKYDYNFGVDFSKYHTYQWVSLPTIHPDQLMDQQIKQAIDAQLAAKGFTQAATNPDLQVGYQIAVQQEKQWDAWGTGGAWRFGGGMGQATSSTINVGTLGIDFFDPNTKQLVWRGYGTKTIEPSGNPEKNMERLQKAVAKILKHFPPEKKK
jgi:hypothetical protein